jgi:hypothetical protein
MKHVSISTNETKKVIGNPKSQVDFDNVSKDEGSMEPMEKCLTPVEDKKQKFNVYEQFSTMAESNMAMLQKFVETNARLKNMLAQIGCFIDKL